MVVKEITICEGRVMKKTIICVALAGAMLLAGCGKIGSKEPTTIDLNNYISYEIEGYSTKATLTYTINYEDIIDDFELEDVAANRLEKKINGTWSQMTYLSNGDEITFEWNVDADNIEEKYNVEFEAEDLKVQIADLEEMPEFDPFDYVEVSFTGMSGDGTGTIDVSDTTPLPEVSYSFDSSYYYLVNGEEIGVTAYVSGYSSLEDYCEEHDYILVTDSATYTVEGLDDYLSSIDQLTPEMLAELQVQAEDCVNATFTLDEGESITSVSYIGYYLLTAKNNSAWYHNQIYLIYEVRFATPAGDLVLYTYVGFENIILLADGSNEIYDILDTDMPSSWDSEVGVGEYSWGSYEYEHTGYASINDMYNAEFRTELDDYNITNTIPDEYLSGTSGEAAPEETEAPAEEAVEETEAEG